MPQTWGSLGLKGKPARCVGFRGTRLQIPGTCVTRGRLLLLPEPALPHLPKGVRRSSLPTVRCDG